METTLVFLVLWAGIARLSGATPPPPIETITIPRDHPKYSTKHGYQPSVTTPHEEDYSAYYRSKCYTYEGLLNDMFPTDYLLDPVRDLRVIYVSTNLEVTPDEKYYQTVLKTYDAVQRDFLRPVTRTMRIHREGMRSELYLTAPDYFQNRLISHSDIARARRYFSVKMEKECEAFNNHKVQHAHAHTDIERKCLKPDEIRDIERQMDNIYINAAPGQTYYKLVLKTNRAVQCNQLTAVEGTLFAGAQGVKTQEYVFEQDKSRLTLPSIFDRQEARIFFRERKQKSQDIPGRGMSNYKSSAGGSDNVSKAVAAAAGAAAVAYKTDSSSDSSDDRHKVGRKQVIVPSAFTPSPDGVKRQRDVPLYPIKESVGTTSGVPLVAVSPPNVRNTMMAGGVAVPQTKPVLLQKQSSLGAEEDIDIRVNVEANISIRKKVHE